jgi:ectoine hydroxylase-related dioxygenase (phytanoyl-CoA dioxygenase family)
MPQQVPLNDEQRSRFERDGVLKLERLLDRASVALACEAVLGSLERLGLWRDGNWRLDERPKPIWPDRGLKPSRDIGHRHPEVEALIQLPAIKAVVEHLLGGADFDRKVFPRPQVLASLPNADDWVLPSGWHTDMPRLARGGSPGIQAFMFLDSVRPRGGGTLVIAGSHRLLNGGRNMKANEITAALRTEPFFQHLFSRRIGATDVEALPVGRVSGTRLEVVELVGEPGDAWLIDLRALHAAAPNCSDRPRLMATHRFVRSDRMPEIAQAFGWT